MSLSELRTLDEKWASPSCLHTLDGGRRWSCRGARHRNPDACSLPIIMSSTNASSCEHGGGTSIGRCGCRWLGVVGQQARFRERAAPRAVRIRAGGATIRRCDSRARRVSTGIGFQCDRVAVGGAAGCHAQDHRGALCARCGGTRPRYLMGVLVLSSEDLVSEARWRGGSTCSDCVPVMAVTA